MRMTIGNKLAAGFGSVLLLMVISNVLVYEALRRMSKSSDEVSFEAVPLLRTADDLTIALGRVTIANRGYLLLGHDDTQAAYFEAEFDAAFKALDEAMASLKELTRASTYQHDVLSTQSIEDRLNEFRTAQQQLRHAAKQAGNTADRDLSQAITIMETRSVPATREVQKAAEALRNVASQRLSEERKELEDNRDQAMATLIMSSLLAVAIGAGVGFVLSRGISSTVRELLAGVQTVARGDLAQPHLRVNSRDEIGELVEGFNTMVASLRAVIGEVSTTTGEIAAASGQIAASAQQQLTSLNETASSLNEITATAEQFKATMQEFSDRAQAVHEAASETTKRASEGLSLTRESAMRIEQVQANSIEAGESVLSLAEQMQRIGEITASVNEIAEQTKLLALNASIEAARAGEEGRGFAVVAMQVRELANQSKDAAGRIESLISQTQKSMQTVVSKIEEGGRLSQDSTQTVRRVSEAFEEIVRAIEQTREAMAQINAGARQQEAAITELVSSITEIDSASKESVAAAEQTEKSIVAIDQRLRSLNEAVARFNT